MTDREKLDAAFMAWVNSPERGLTLINSDVQIQIEWKAWQAALASQQPADDGWIEWAGGRFNCGEIPVSDETPVEVKARVGLNQGLAGWLRWHHSGNDHDIIAYRVVKP